MLSDDALKDFRYEEQKGYLKNALLLYKFHKEHCVSSECEASLHNFIEFLQDYVNVCTPISCEAEFYKMIEETQNESKTHSD